MMLLVACDKPKEKSSGELYEEAQIYLTDIEKNDPVKALEILNKVITLDPGSIKAYLSRADAYVDLGENEKAFEDFNTAIQLNSDAPDIYLKRGEIYSDLKQYEKAFEDYNHAIRLKPNLANAYFERGKVYLAVGVYNLDDLDLESVRILVPTPETHVVGQKVLVDYRIGHRRSPDSKHRP